MLEIGRVVGAGGKQNDLRVGDSGGRYLLECSDQLGAVIVDRTQTNVVEQIGKGAQHHVPVLDDIADARGCARVVLEHQERAALVAHDVSAANVDIGLVRQIDAAHQRAVVVVAEDQLGRDHAVAQHMLIMVNVVEQQVDRRDPLDDAALYVPPLLSRQHARQDVERQDAVDRPRVRVDRKGDPKIVELGVRGGGALFEHTDRQAREALADDMARRAAQHLAKEALRIVTVEDREFHPPTRDIGRRPHEAFSTPIWAKVHVVTQRPKYARVRIGAGVAR